MVIKRDQSPPLIFLCEGPGDIISRRGIWDAFKQSEESSSSNGFPQKCQSAPRLSPSADKVGARKEHADLGVSAPPPRAPPLMGSAASYLRSASISWELIQGHFETESPYDFD